MRGGGGGFYGGRRGGRGGGAGSEGDEHEGAADMAEGEQDGEGERGRGGARRYRDRFVRRGGYKSEGGPDSGREDMGVS